MLYYLIESENKNVTIKKIENATDSTYKELKNQGFKVVGVFGREDYAKKWQNYYNGKITIEELKKFLNS